MSAPWDDDDEVLKAGGMKGVLRSKPRFSLTEVKLLLDAVKKNRYIILKKFNQGVSAEAKKQTWAEITAQINGLGENHREVRQIMKKWADLKCDGKRRIVALRGPNGSTLRKKKLGPVEKMVHKILVMSPTGDGNSDQEFGDDDDVPKLFSKSPNSSAPPYSYLGMTDSSHSFPGGVAFDISPLSSPEKDLSGDPYHSSSEFDMDMGDDGERTMDFDENDDSLFSSLPSSLPPPSAAPPDLLPNNPLLRVKPVHTYSRNSSQNNNHVQNLNSTRPTPGPSSSSDAAASTSSVVPPASNSDAALPSAGPPLSHSPTSSNATASSLPPPPPASSSTAAASDTTSDPAPSPSTLPPPASSTAVTSSSSSSSSSFVTIAPSLSVLLSNPQQPPSLTSSTLPSSQPATSMSDPLPAGASSHRSQDHVAQMAFQSVQQQRASRMLLTSVSQSLEVLAQSVQLLVESQHEFVQESLLLQRETVDILRDFSNTALTMLRDKSNSGQHPLPPRF
ncbi:hypothetical protein JOB18_042705 [Solea senegalensis]|uniref:Myb/SANT-like DNA-binding domain-containing protein n=1 Tax=Solea senegalensis TaxID=28829 RepID=A0AAV6PYU7_SOLSE|nr:flocculation protein FLO11 isoform X1 [Solea senegalensis]KAG7480076.1 hypothetical protein JOB18_042705 [Solea senegalensis]